MIRRPSIFELEHTLPAGGAGDAKGAPGDEAAALRDLIHARTVLDDIAEDDGGLIELTTTLRYDHAKGTGVDALSRTGGAGRWQQSHTIAEESIGIDEDEDPGRSITLAQEAAAAADVAADAAGVVKTTSTTTTSAPTTTKSQPSSRRSSFGAPPIWLVEVPAAPQAASAVVTSTAQLATARLNT